MTCLPTTTWFLSDENGQPLGQTYRPQIPEVGVQFEGTNNFGVAEIVSVEELRPTCSMRRFKVVVRVIS